ncbi:MAG: GNAT family N-acetyltransferase [Mesorhizobium sp.]|nr:GNAT family N-acetyltransferase [Mesorhizobium sp.]MBL8579494.1 GNAT family N-acetyltransferase [Mesorhizobium sp.]
MTPRIIRTLDPAEVGTLVDWAAGEGWNPGLDDAAAFSAADPEGFLGAFVDGDMLAGICAVRYGVSYGFIGLYISHPDHRGEGHGKAVWDAGMARLSGRIVGLDGVDAQFDNYLSKGFVPAYRTIRFGGRFSPVGEGVDVGVPRPVDFTPALLEEAITFDGKIFPQPRRAFLERWLAPPHIVSVAVSGGRMAGYGVMRACGVGSKIGCLAAIDLPTAKALFVSLADQAEGEVFIDVPQPQGEFARFLAASNLVPGFETTRMYHGGAIPLYSGLFGVTTLELG